MYLSPSMAEQILQTALTVLQQPDQSRRAALNMLPDPIYATDADGQIIYFNSACVAFAGRTPRLGQDRWCVTWRLYTENGTPLPHESCPMAIAIQQKRPVRGASAIAERPDGSRIGFTPYPTPWLNADGEVLGAVNMLIDTGDEPLAGFLHTQAARCRQLAALVTDRWTAAMLREMAAEYVEKTEELARRKTARRLN